MIIDKKILSIDASELFIDRSWAFARGWSRFVLFIRYELVRSCMGGVGPDFVSHWLRVFGLFPGHQQDFDSAHHFLGDLRWISVDDHIPV